MKKVLSVIFALAIFFTMLPMQSLGAKGNTVDFYGNSIPVGIRALKITRYRSQSGEYNGKYYVPSETPLDCGLLAEKFPDLYVLELNDGCVENTEALSKLKNLAELKLTCKDDMGENFSDLSFLEGMKNLRSLYIYNDKRVDIDISVLGNLTKLTELYLNFLWPYEYYDDRMFDISPLEKLTKIKNLTLYFETKDISPLKNMTELQSADIVSESLSDGIEVFRDMPKLEYLRLYGANISDAKQMSELKNLKTLKLLNCRFSPFTVERVGESINGIGELENLENFELYFQSRSCFPSRRRADLNFVSKLTKLKSLKINGYSMTNCDFLKDLTSLEELDLNDCGVSDISGLAGLTELKSLDIYDHRVTDISALENLTKLERLCLERTSYSSSKQKMLRNVKVLSKLTELRELFLSGNKIKDFGFLKKLDKLELLYIEETGWNNNKISKPIVEKFIENHPDCKVKK